MPKKLRQKFKYLENEKNLQDEMKSIFHHFWSAEAELNHWSKKSYGKVRVRLYGGN